MNRIFRPLGNDKANLLSTTSTNVHQRRFASPSIFIALAGSLSLAFGASAYALPTDGAVVAGAATIAATANTTTINQSSENTVINWKGFSIAGDEAVRFVQPNGSSVALNRVLGPDPSNIFGSLSANGKVFLVNPNGVLFGAGAQVNVAGLVASTMDIADADFMSGQYKFAGTGGAVLNRGSITADGGYVALLGASVTNEGTIAARLGTVALAAGKAITLDIVGDGLLNVIVNQGALNALVQNGGLIRANGGQVLLTTQAAGDLLKTVVNNTGIIEAQTLENHHGTIALLGDMQSGTVNVGGTLDVSGTKTGQTGGSVVATGQHVGLFGAQINASGDAGGGTVLIGGDLHGTNTAIQNASATYMSADSTINADAKTAGNGGKVVLWANGSTRAFGSISAHGGAQSGNGGLVETSGHWLDVVGINVDAKSSIGLSGMWLLDPADVIIGAGTTDGSTSAGVFSPNSGVSSATVDAGTIQATLNGGTDVTITTENIGAPGAALGDITVSSALTWTTGNTLTLTADHDVIVNAAITASTANSKIVLTAANDVNVGAALVASGQNSEILLSAGHDVVATAAITATALNAVIDMNAGNNVSVVAVTADGGGSVVSVNLHADNDVLVNGAISAAGGSVALIADQDGTGPGVLGGTVSFVSPGAVVASSNTTIRFNPNGYTNTATEIAGYATEVTGTLDAKAWVFPVGVDKPYDGLDTATLQFKDPVPGDNPNVGNTVTLIGGTATFDTKDVGTLKTISFFGYTLGGADAERFAIFALPSVESGEGTTTGNISAIPLTITADDHSSKTYGSEVTFSGTEFTDSGLVNGEQIGSVTLVSAGAAKTAGVGSYGITPSDATANGAFDPSNYIITYVDGALPVNPAPLTVTANDASKTYGQAITFAGSAFTSNGLQNGETIGAVTETSPGAGVTASVAGSPYAITPDNATGGSFDAANYTITYVDGTLLVAPASLTVTANDASKTDGQAITFAGSAFTSNGLQNGETIGAVTETSPGAGATASVAGSPYVITPDNATGGSFDAANYTITYVDGVLAILPTATPPDNPVPDSPNPDNPNPDNPVLGGPVPGVIWPMPIVTWPVLPPENKPGGDVAYGIPILAPPGLALILADNGVRMPVSDVTETGAIVDRPVEPPAAPLYVPPVYPRRQDRH